MASDSELKDDSLSVKMLPLDSSPVNLDADGLLAPIMDADAVNINGLDEDAHSVQSLDIDGEL